MRRARRAVRLLCVASLLPGCAASALRPAGRFGRGAHLPATTPGDALTALAARAPAGEAGPRTEDGRPKTATAWPSSIFALRSSVLPGAARAGRTPVAVNSGWRVGLIHLRGQGVEPVSQLAGAGGALSLWGYEWEFEHGRFGEGVGLFKLVPLVAGLERSLAIPVANVLVGVRFPGAGRWQWEVAAGPHISPRMEEVFEETPTGRVPGWGLAVGLGATCRTSGGVNVPIGLCYVSAGDAEAWGLTFGWNMAK